MVATPTSSARLKRGLRLLPIIAADAKNPETLFACLQKEKVVVRRSHFDANKLELLDEKLSKLDVGFFRANSYFKNYRCK